MPSLPQTPEQLILAAESQLQEAFSQIEERCHHNTQKIMQAFHDCGLDDSHFAAVTGYAHNDLGREVSDAIYAQVFGAEAACVRLQFVSGTHAIACALRGCLSPNDTLISLTGAPYDTLEPILGKRDAGRQSLTHWGVHYDEVDCFSENALEKGFLSESENKIRHAQVAFIQRSRGYAQRPSLGISDLEQLIRTAKALQPKLKVVVDNCYGEFVEMLEPTQIGADIVAGSLIKNPGGGIVPTGGYLAGKSEIIQSAAEVLTAPGLGLDGGYTFDSTRLMLQGLYFAPMIVREALKSMRLAATVFQALGYETSPASGEAQNDIIQAIQVGSPENVLAFCKALQAASPVGSKLTPIPAVTPGYESPIVMAGGTFIFGSTIELSADAPMREPYTVFLQGGLNYSHSRYTLKKILQSFPVK